MAILDVWLYVFEVNKTEIQISKQQKSHKHIFITKMCSPIIGKNKLHDYENKKSKQTNKRKGK